MRTAFEQSVELERELIRKNPGNAAAEAAVKVLRAKRHDTLNGYTFDKGVDALMELVNMCNYVASALKRAKADATRQAFGQAIPIPPTEGLTCSSNDGHPKTSGQQWQR
jgi:hypothetical protein